MVRDSMSGMLKVWKEIPKKDQPDSCLKEIGGDGRCLPASMNCVSSSPFASRKRRIPICRSSLNAVTPIVAAKKIEIDQRKDSRLINEKKNSDAGSEDSLTSEERGVKSCQQQRTQSNGRSRLEVKRVLFEKNWEDKKKLGSRIVPFEETGSSEVMTETVVVSEKFHGEQKDGDLSLIRMQLVQIENQQSSLLNLLQRFIGSSQKGIHSLEARVLNLEIALDNMSRDIVSTSSGRVMNNDRVAKKCCRLPGTEFLSSKFWRRAESTYASRFLTYKQESQKFGLSGGFINPLAEASPQVLGNTTRYNGTKVA